MVLPSSGKAVALFDWLDGEAGGELLKRGGAALMAQLGALGRTLGQLHALPELPAEQFNVPFAMGWVEMAPFVAEQRAAQPGEPLAPFVAELERECLGRLRSQLESDAALPRGVVHGDAFLDNVLFERADSPQLVGLIDFEEVCRDALLLDVAMTIVGGCFVNNQLQEDLVVALLRGYVENKQSTLDSHGRATLPAMCEYAAYSIAFWRYRQFVVRFPNADNKTSWEEMKNRVCLYFCFFFKKKN